MGIKPRTVKTASGKTAVQIVRYTKGSRDVIKHIGSSSTQAGIMGLLALADERIRELLGQQSFLPDDSQELEKRAFESQYEILAHKYYFLYEALSQIYSLLGFDSVDTNLFKDLCIMRIVDPVSKTRSLRLLDRLFSKKYSINILYKTFSHLQSKKKVAEKAAVNFATSVLKQNVSVLFYDVTTIYFESMSPDELKKLGFSKDGKFTCPQVMLGLVMSDIGFPIAYQLFNGKKFEGHTMIPVLQKFVDTHKVKNITVVADAAMISDDNVKALEKAEYEYIVGARLGNINRVLAKEIISQNKRIDQQTIELETGLGRLIIHYSQKRYRKDKYELKKSIKEAKKAILNPSKMKKKFKYVQKIKQKKKEPVYELNEQLIKQREQMLGLKGYYTNTELSHDAVITHYANLWKIEKDFRILKSDLKVRPLYHWKAPAIQSHLVLCFMALCVSQYIEISTGESIEQFIEKLRQVQDTEVLVKKTGTKIVSRNNYPQEIDVLVKNALNGRS